MLIHFLSRSVALEFLQDVFFQKRSDYGMGFGHRLVPLQVF